MESYGCGRGQYMDTTLLLTATFMPNQAPTKGESDIARAILEHTDRESLAVLTTDAARELPVRVHLPESTMRAIWSIVDSEKAGFLSFKQVTRLVRLVGYAQTREPIKRELLRTAGPTCRIDEWTVPLGKTFEKPCNEEEQILVNAIMKEADPDGFGILDGNAAKNVMSRSGLPNGTLAEIWEIVDEGQRGFLEARDLKRIIRLISCAQRGERLHARQYENPCPLPDLDDSFVTPTPIPVIPLQPALPSPAYATTPTPLIITPNNHSRSISLPVRLPDDPLPPLRDVERKAFISVFQRNNPVNGIITGDQCRTVFNRSRLPVETLAHIWNLADFGKLGMLSQTQFILAMYLIKVVMDKKISRLPDTLPAWLLLEATKGDTDDTSRYSPAGGSSSPHSRSQSQPASTPQLSLLDMNNEEMGQAPPRGSSLSPPRQTPQISPIPSPNLRLDPEYLNRPVPPPPLPSRLSDEAPPPYVEIEHTTRIH
ncbi:hypothetical protein FRC14_003774 [Serendipita sp. 396]|nr:hypothetical protein FRC14_003774 [Serendipita sp. 396]KAG9054562.1 hypothetical protein FS842_004776 [Serendipita sp. 407]